MPLRVGIDVSSLMGVRTGVGEATALMLQGLALAAPQHELAESRWCLFANSLRNEVLLPEEVRSLQPVLRRWRLPNRYLLQAWERWAWPPVEYLTGGLSVFHATNFYTPPLRKAAGVATLHDLFFMTANGYGAKLGGAWFREVLPTSLERTAAIIVPSASTAQMVEQFFPHHAAKVRVVPWALRSAAEHARSTLQHKEKRHTEPDALRLLAVGTLEPRKDYPLMLEVAAVLARRGVPFQLQIAGGTSWVDLGLPQRAAELGIAGQVTFLGYQTQQQLESLYQQADLFLSTSLDEGFCLPLLHALDRGTPAVVVPAGALPDVLGQGGLVSPDRDPVHFADAVEHLSAALYSDLEWNRRAKTQASTFTLETLGRQTLDVYASVR